jgi:DNA-binding NarL/FixJ family response regulator
VLVRILCGTQQKVLADDFRLAHSTVSKRHTTALRKLHVDGQPIPLTVVLAALRSEKLVEVRAARRATFVHQNRTHVVVSVPRPRVPSPSRLTMAEREIALQLLEGQSRHQIAVARRASVQTVSCQLRTIFAKLRVSGRFAAMRRAGEQGWFEGA